METQHLHWVWRSQGETGYSVWKHCCSGQFCNERQKHTKIGKVVITVRVVFNLYSWRLSLLTYQTVKEAHLGSWMVVWHLHPGRCIPYYPQFGLLCFCRKRSIIFVNAFKSYEKYSFCQFIDRGQIASYLKLSSLGSKISLPGSFKRMFSCGRKIKPFINLSGRLALD